MEQVRRRDPGPDGTVERSGGDTDVVRGTRVLVAAADAARRWSSVGVLREAGASVAEARSGVEALDLARESRPDLVVADPELPSLGGATLRTALQRDPELGDVPVVLLGDTHPAPGDGRLQDRVLSEAAARLLEVHRREAAEPSDAADPLSERENLRAQSTVSMYQQPANHARRLTCPVWRLRESRGRPGTSLVSGFGFELRVMSRILGAAFVAVIAATVGLIGWHWIATTSEPAPVQASAEQSTGAPPQTTRPASTQRAEPPSAAKSDEEDFAGELRPGVDAALSVGPGQGVLALSGSSEVTVFVDGIERGRLPVTLVLDQGRHRVGYAHGGRRAVRFYFVKAGATRSLDVVTRPSGFVDAR